MMKKGLYITSAAILLMTVCLLSFPPSGIAGDKKGCSFLGSWYGYNPPSENPLVDETLLWIVNVMGQSQSSGTNNLEAPGYDPTFGGAFPTGVKVTNLRGAWQKTGRNTFSLTMIGFSVDSMGNTVGIGKMSGTSTLMNGCDTERLDLTLELFGPTDDPFTDDPFFGFALPPHYGYRMVVDPPYQN